LSISSSGAYLKASKVPFPCLISDKTGRFFTILMPASFFRIRPFAALYASSASFALRRHQAFELFDIGAGIESHPFDPS